MKKLLLSLVLLTTLPLATQARWCAYAISRSSDSYGAVGFTYNYGTSSAAVNAAVRIMPGYSPYSYRYWNHKRYSAVARGYNYDASGYSLGYARGYGTRSGAVNGAISAVSRYRRYSLTYLYGYNH